MTESRFNIIGFWPAASSLWRPTLKCPIHSGSALVHMDGDDPYILRCVRCGCSVPYKEDEEQKSDKERHIVRK
jgi:hypothetical protein